MSFRGNINSILRSYLENRYQSVTIGGNTSNLVEIRHGVPQSSVLAPLLFNLFINDLTHLESDGITLIADDLAFCIIDDFFDSLMERTQKLVNNVSHWLQCNRLFPNTSKTFLMLFTPRKINAFPSIYFNGDVL